MQKFTKIVATVSDKRCDVEFIKQLAEEKMTMVIVTHEMGFAREVASRVMFINEGVICEENEPKEFFENPQNQRLREFLSKVL